MKYKLNLLAIGCCMLSWLPTARADEPSILELRVMQSRKYESTAKEFLLSIKEICRARGGTFIGHVDYSNAGSTMVSNRMFESHGADCMNYNGGQRAQANLTGISFKVEGRVLDPKNLLIRIFAKDARGAQITSSKTYDLIFKDISEAIGLSDIPIQVNRAE